ncbi:MAG: hypothetical protein AB7O52_17235 [Planctomycetota bacterium]
MIPSQRTSRGRGRRRPSRVSKFRAGVSAMALFLWIGSVPAQETKPATPPAADPKPATRPESPSAPDAPTETAAGRALLLEVVAACGGERLAALHTFRWKSRETRLLTSGGVVERDVEGTLQLPEERFRMDFEQGAQKSYYVVTEKGGWQRSPTSLQDFTEALCTDFRRNLRTSTTPLLRAHAELVAQELPLEVLAGKEYRILRVWRGTDGPVDLFIDPDDLTISRRRSSVVVNGQVVVREEKLWDYRVVDGLKLPFARSMYDDGKNVATITTIQYTLNVPIPEGHFDRPSG